MITLADDRLSFTFPEIAWQLRAHVERQIGHILPEFLRPEERTALLAELESRWGFRRLDDAAQDRHRLRVLTLTADEIEAALRTAALRAAGLHDASFPALTIAFQRTLRIPDDGRTYPLPAGLGAFPLRSVDDFPATAPASWLQRGGVVLPMHQSEALWISFSARYPCAVKIAAGKINAVSGEALCWDGGDQAAARMSEILKLTPSTPHRSGRPPAWRKGSAGVTRPAWRRQRRRFPE